MKRTLGEKAYSVLQEHGAETHFDEDYNLLQTFTPPVGLESSPLDFVVSSVERSKAFEKLPGWMTAGGHASLEDVMGSIFPL